MKLTGCCIECSKRTQGRDNNSFLCRKCKQSKEFSQIIKLLHDISSFDLGWVIGLIEGEGCFYKKGSNSKLKDDIYCYPLAGFTLMSTDKDIMERLIGLLRLTLNGPYYKKSKKKRKEVWSIQVTGNKAIAIMQAIRQHLGARRQEQIDEAIKWQEQGRLKIEALLL